MSKVGSEYKVVVLGDKGVGKTSLVLRYIEGYFSPKQQSTIAAFFLTKKLSFADGQTGKMQLWDTAGQERFKSMVPMYYKNADAAIVCFDSSDEETFGACRDWITELRNNAGNNEICLVICSTKCDGPDDERRVTLTKIRDYASSVGAVHFETSAKKDIGVNELFDFLCTEVSTSLGEHFFGGIYDIFTRNLTLFHSFTQNIRSGIISSSRHMHTNMLLALNRCTPEGS